MKSSNATILVVSPIRIRFHDPSWIIGRVIHPHTLFLSRIYADDSKKSITLSRCLINVARVSANIVNATLIDGFHMLLANTPDIGISRVTKETVTVDAGN